MKEFSIVVPVYNEENFIEGMLKSAKQIDYPSDKYEIIVVNDASTDNTGKIANQIDGVRVINLNKNVGRYAARKMGAEVATYPHILYIDSRAVVDRDILSALNTLDEKAVVGTVLQQEKPGLFDTFYIAVRRIIFHKHFALAKDPIRLTKENFDSFAKGTTVLYVEKEMLFKAHKALSTTEMGKNSSDDIRLINAIVRNTDVVVHPDVRIIGLSRTSFRVGYLHLMWRGRTFTDYYLHPSKRNFWLIIVLPLLAILSILIMSFLLSISGIAKLITLLGLDLIITLILARSLREFAIIPFMLPVCVSAFYIGIIQGIYLKIHEVLLTKKSNMGSE